MNRCQTLADVLAAIVVAALPLAAAGCCGGATEARSHERITLSPTDPSISSELSACLDNDAECLALCNAILRKNGWESPETEVVFEECRVFDGARIELSMTYFVPEECIAGRRPDGYLGTKTFTASATASPCAAWLADMAVLEAAAVHAFIQTARHLRALGAPAELIERALAAAGDEVAHARVMRGLAAGHGVCVELPQVAPIGAPSLEAFATQNAIEGCVRETFGALIAAWQSAAATEPTIRDVMARIAVDEAGHAELSRDIDAWAQSRLSDEACRRVEAAKRTAEAEILSGQHGEPPPEAARALGLPNRCVESELARALFGT